MGCDIHAWIEYDFEGEIPFGYPAKILSFSRGELAVSRDYQLFRLLAGVRGEEGDAPIFPLRGIPPYISGDVARQYYLFVAEKSHPAWEDGNCVTPEDAEDLIRRGVSHRYQSWISSPDWHHAGWLTPAETGKVLEALQESRRSIFVQPKEERWISDESAVVFEALASLAKKIGEDRVRFVFLFDS